MIVWPVEPTNMKYAEWYDKLVSLAKNRKLPKETYTEGHHIIPKSMGGSDKKENIVRFLAREHYIAHALLWKMKFEGEANMKMVHAFNQMSIMKPTKDHPGYRVNSRLFEQVKLERSAHLKTIRGPDHPCYGKTPNISPEGKVRKQQAVKDFWADPENKEMMAEKRRQFFETPEGIAQRQRHSARVKGVPRDPAHVEKTASKKRGKKAEEIFSPQAIANMNEGRKNRVLTPEGRARISESSRIVGKRPKSAEHKKKISESNKGKHNHTGEANPMFGKNHSSETIEKIKETKRLQKIAKLATMFCGPIKPKTVFRFRGVNYLNLTVASVMTGVNIGKIKTQIKHWGTDPSPETIKLIDNGTLKPPMVAWNKGTKGKQVSWSKGKKLSPSHVAKSVASKKAAREAKKNENFSTLFKFE